MAQKIIRACRGYPTVDLYEKPTKAKLLLVSEISFLRTKNSAIKSSDILKCQKKNNTHTESVMGDLIWRVSFFSSLNRHSLSSIKTWITIKDKRLYKIQFQKMTVYMMCVKGAIRQTIQAASAHRRMDAGEDKTGLPKRHPIVIFFEKTFKWNPRFSSQPFLTSLTSSFHQHLWSVVKFTYS